MLPAVLAILLIAGPGGAAGDAGPFTHGRRDLPKVALTFDGCSSVHGNPCDAALLEAIRAAGIPATFFLGGIWMEHNADVVRALAANPAYELGLHGWGHKHPAKLTDAQLDREFDRSIALYTRLAGRAPRLYRPPFGRAEPRDLAQAAKRGLVVVEYDVPAGDSDPGATAGRLVRWVGRKAVAGSVVIFHVNGRGVHTFEALPGIVARLREKGLAFATVGELAAGR